jgi:hypothetical protein
LVFLFKPSCSDKLAEVGAGAFFALIRCFALMRLFRTYAPFSQLCAFFTLMRFCARKREAKKSAKAARKKSTKKAKAASAQEKSVNFHFFLPPTLKAQFQS